jgi:hypothetical protein
MVGVMFRPQLSFFRHLRRLGRFFVEARLVDLLLTGQPEQLHTADRPVNDVPGRGTVGTT